MPKNFKPDFSKDQSLCRYEIYISIPKDVSEDFLRDFNALIEELNFTFGLIPVTYLLDSSESETSLGKRHFVFFAKHNVECENLFSRKVPIWKQEFGNEEFIVIRSNVDNLAYNTN